MPNQLITTVRFNDPNTSIIDIAGDITAQSEETLMAAYTESVQAGATSIILNFEGLDFMNSSGIGLLVTILIRVQRKKQKLLAFGLSDHYQQIFELTRLNEAIGIHADEASACAATLARI